LGVAISSDGRWVATGQMHGHGVKVWDATTGKQVAFLLPSERISSVRFSPDCKWLVTSASGPFRFWRVRSWAEGLTVARESNGIGPAFSPDGSVVALETAPAQVRLLDPETGEEFATLEDPFGHRLRWMGFTPDGSRLVTVSNKQGIVHVWELGVLR